MILCRNQTTTKSTYRPPHFSAAPIHKQAPPFVSFLPFRTLSAPNTFFLQTNPFFTTVQSLLCKANCTAQHHWSCIALSSPTVPSRAWSPASRRRSKRRPARNPNPPAHRLGHPPLVPQHLQCGAWANDRGHRRTASAAEPWLHLVVICRGIPLERLGHCFGHFDVRWLQTEHRV